MSFHETVSVKLECQKCGRIHPADVRFRSYSGRADGEYELMEVAPQADGLRRGEVWEGNADRYCNECFKRWAEAQAYAGYDALAELSEKGLVTVRAKRSATPLTRAEINQYAEKYARAERKQGGITVSMPYFEELDLTIRNKPCHTLDLDIFETDEAQFKEADETWSEFLGLIDPLIRERLAKDGWAADDNTWEDFQVMLDDRRRVVVKDMQGKRLTRNGARIE